MRKLILHMITSIDGSIADEDGNVNPATQWDEEMQSFYLETFNAADTTVFGRRLYEQYVEYWARVAAGDILLMCGPGLVAHLTTRRLIDEYMLFMCPNALGRGVHLFRDISEPVNLTFQRSRLFRGGVNFVYYTPRH